MKRFILWSLGGLSVIGLALAAGCDSDGDETGAGGSTAVGTGGACTCYPCADYIAECINECPSGDPRDVLCDTALPVLNDVNLCICDAARGNCRDLCPATCAISDMIAGGGAGQGGAAEDDPGCVPCQAEAISSSGPCIQEWDACAANDSCD